MGENTEGLTAMVIDAMDAAQAAEMHAVTLEEFGDKSPEFIEGYLKGMTDVLETMSQDMLSVAMTTIPITLYLKELKGE